MYQLHYDKEKCVLEVKPLKKVFHNLKPEISDEIMKYNHAFYFCSNRKKLVEFAKELKEEWLQEAKERLTVIEKIEI